MKFITTFRKYVIFSLMYKNTVILILSLTELIAVFHTPLHEQHELIFVDKTH